MSIRRYWLFLLLAFGHFVSIVHTSATCVLCGEHGPESAPFTERALPDLGVPANSCGDLVEAVLFVQGGTAICDSIQAFGTYCGCNLPPNACHLCWDGSRVSNKNLTLPDYQVSTFADTFGYDSNPACETLEALLHTTRTSDTQQCLDIQIDAGERCGCPPVPVELLPHNNSTNFTGNDFDNESNVDTPPKDKEPTKEQRCTLCENGVSTPVPNQWVDIGQERTLTCAEWEILATSFPEGSADCALIRSGASRICQCPRPQGQCTMCPLGEPIPRPQQRLNWLFDSFLSSDRDSIVTEDSRSQFLTCQLMESHVASGHPLLDEIFGTEEELLCTAMQMKSWICGCQPDWRQIVLTWSYRLSAMLSFVVSDDTRPDPRPSSLSYSCLLGVWPHHSFHSSKTKHKIHNIPPTCPRHIHL